MTQILGILIIKSYVVNVIVRNIISCNTVELLLDLSSLLILKKYR